MKDKRRYKRFSVDILGINGKMLFANAVEILDISLGGVSLKVDRRLNIRTEYALKMGSGDQVISVKGSVVWSKISGTKRGSKGDVIPIYSAGMRFSGVTGEKAEELSRFIERATSYTHEEAHRLSGLRFNMRFPINKPGKTILDLSEQYAVKKLSFGGMLIESRDTFPIEDRVPMELFLPGERRIQFIGRIASCFSAPDADPATYDIGIEFFEMPDDDKSALKEFILLLGKSRDIR